MYNNNGIALLNRTYSASSSSITFSSYINNLITFTDGTTNENNPLILYFTSSLSIGTVINAIQKLTPTQKFASSYAKTTGVPSSYDLYGYYHVGYRATPFTSDTYTDVPTIPELALSVTTTAGLPTITAYNTSASNIAVNEVTYLINAGITSSSAKTVLLAGFHFPDITIAPGETYTFTIMHKNS